jgi:integrase
MASGWIVRAPSGRWKASYRTPERRTRSKTFDRKTDAERWRREMLSSVDQGGHVDPALGKMTLGAFFTGSFMRSATARLRPKTQLSYASVAKNHILPNLGGWPLARISRLDVEDWLASLQERGVSAATTGQAHRVLRAVLSAAVRADIISRNVASGVRPPRVPPREMRALTAEEVSRIVAEVPERHRALVLILAYSGMRVGEAMALRIDNLDLLRGKVTVVESVTEVGSRLVFGPTKSGRNRSVSLPSIVTEILRARIVDYPPIAGLVFTDSHGSVMRETNFIRQVWYPAVRRAGIDEPLPRVHDLRHTAAALAISTGVSAKVIQERLGHSSIVVTMDRYGHLLPGLDEKLANDLDQIARGQPLSAAPRES